MSLEGFMKRPNRKNIVSRKEEPLNWERKLGVNALAEPQVLDLSSLLPLSNIRKAKEKVGQGLFTLWTASTPPGTGTLTPRQGR